MKPSKDAASSSMVHDAGQNLLKGSFTHDAPGLPAERVCVCSIREEWDWMQTLAAAGERDRSSEDSEEVEPRAESHAPLLYYELQTAIKSLLKHMNLPLHQVHTPAPHKAASLGFIRRFSPFLSSSAPYL